MCTELDPRLTIFKPDNPILTDPTAIPRCRLVKEPSQTPTACYFCGGWMIPGETPIERITEMKSRIIYNRDDVRGT